MNSQSAADRLITATQELLWERGYTGTSPKAIQARSGVGQGSMYHHFPSKAALALAAEERTTAEVLDSIDAKLVNGKGSAIDRLTAYVLSPYRDALEGCPTGRLAADPDIVADPTLRAPLAEVFAKTATILGHVIEQAQQEGDIRPELDAARLAETIQATRQGAYILARATADRAAFTRALKGLLSTITTSATRT